MYHVCTYQTSMSRRVVSCRYMWKWTHVMLYHIFFFCKSLKTIFVITLHVSTLRICTNLHIFTHVLIIFKNIQILSVHDIINFKKSEKKLTKYKWKKIYSTTKSFNIQRELLFFVKKFKKTRHYTYIYLDFEHDYKYCVLTSYLNVSYHTVLIYLSSNIILLRTNIFIV